MKKKKRIALLAGLSAISVSVLFISGLLWPCRTRGEASAIKKPIPSEAANQSEVTTAWKAPDQEAAMERAKERIPFVETFIDECLLCRQMKLRGQGLSTKDIPNPYILLNSPVIQKQEDHYGPVRFMHAKHAAKARDCAVCHHYRPADPKALETTRCSACHQEPFKKSHPERIGLKAAYHLQCMACHQDMNQGPVDCIGCHAKKTPDHKDLVKLPENPAPEQVTEECLRCHREAGEDMLTSAHWLWKGPSPNTLDHSKEIEHGKGTTVFNNY